jgi:hypothetical protein
VVHPHARHARERRDLQHLSGSEVSYQTDTHPLYFRPETRYI